MRHNNTERAIVEGPRGDRVLAVGYAGNWRNARVERSRRYLRAGFERHDAMLHVEKQPIEAGYRHGFGDLDAARHAHANPERQLTLFELFACDIADSDGHRRHSLATWRRRWR